MSGEWLEDQLHTALSLVTWLLASYFLHLHGQLSYPAFNVPEEIIDYNMITCTQLLPDLSPGTRRPGGQSISRSPRKEPRKFQVK
jgi:hypothetical protein